MTLFISLGIFLTLLLLFEGGRSAYHAYLSPKTKALKRRLRGAAQAPSMRSSANQVEVLRKRVLSEIPWLETLLTRLPRLNSIERTLQQANSSLPLGVFMLLSGVLAFVGLEIAVFQNTNVLLMLLATIVGGSVPFVYMVRQRSQRFHDFQRQLPDALDLVARALRAGHAFAVGMKMVGDEFPDPIGPEFNRAVEEISFGIEVPEALMNLSTRIECVDLRFFITSIIVQRETGGNLAEILEGISFLIRQRFELLGRVQALTVEGRLSAIVLFLLPFGIGVLLWYLSPSYMGLLWTDPLGQQMMMIVGTMMCTGAVIMKKMVAIKV
ncbi:MAG: type II secretion system F family protein [Nitrospirota bacterium]|nr:type II secretion system F family protein [Nitrospirota bacterium]